MRLLITGGAGFIGSNFIRYILNRYPSYKIINLDILTYAGNLDNLKDIVNNRNYTFVKGDICDEKLMHRLVKKIDVIVNFAASTPVLRLSKKPRQTYLLKKIIFFFFFFSFPLIPRSLYYRENLFFIKKFFLFFFLKKNLTPLF